MALSQGANAARAFIDPTSFATYMGIPSQAAELHGWVQIYGLRAGFIALLVSVFLLRKELIPLKWMAICGIVLPLGGDNYHNLASFGRGSFFGEIAFLDRGVRSANALATTAVDLFVISRARFDEKSRTQPLIGVKVFARIARTLALRLRHSDRELSAFYDA